MADQPEYITDELFDALAALVARTKECDNLSDMGVSSDEPAMVAAEEVLAKRDKPKPFMWPLD